MTNGLARPVVAVIETWDDPRVSSIRVARAFARPGVATVILCHWRSLELFAGGVTAAGRVIEVASGGEGRIVTLDSPSPVQALFFYAPYSTRLGAADCPALRRLSAAGVDVGEASLAVVVDRLMLEASRRGVVTNALGAALDWGPKHRQELKLRSFEQATARTIPRPETHIARSPRELAAALSSFAARGQPCLVKPWFGEGGRDIRVVRPGETVAASGRVVVRRLIPDPLLIAGHKADIRFYVAVVTGAAASRRCGPVFLRRASAAYVATSLPSEITNTAYRARAGLPPDMRLLDAADIPEATRARIIAGLDGLAADLADAYFQEVGNGRDPDVPNRAILLGVDALVTGPQTGHRVLFLETNPFPALFRDLADCDRAVEDMLSQEYLPLLAGNDVRS
jgi:hypothetical protein